jgi:hypothetical protein
LKILFHRPNKFFLDFLFSDAEFQFKDDSFSCECAAFLGEIWVGVRVDGFETNG